MTRDYRREEDWVIGLIDGWRGLSEETRRRISEESEKIYKKLSEVLPQEYKYLVNELETKECDKLCFETRHYFKKGVAAGTSNLNFLRDLTGGTIFY